MPANVFQESFGGTRTGCIFSGAVVPVANGPGALVTGSDVMFASGAGQLVDVVINAGIASGNTVATTSGTAIVFYDAAAPVSGGPLQASGHIPLFTVYMPVTPPTIASGLTQPAFSVKINVNMPYNSGLCVNSRSGQPGFTASFRPFQQNLF